jgi:hypothetical protein
MLSLIQSFLPILITLTTGVSVLLHDIQYERAASLAVQVPFSTENISDVALMLRDQHTHTERVAVGGSASSSISVSPSIGPRISDDKKYIAAKKMSITTSGSAYIWPSV